jgi:hypothetical protein
MRIVQDQTRADWYKRAIYVTRVCVAWEVERVNTMRREMAPEFHFGPGAVKMLLLARRPAGTA